MHLCSGQRASGFDLLLLSLGSLLSGSVFTNNFMG